MPRGKGERCSGFLSGDGRYAHCSREEHAGGLAQEDGGTFAHLLSGSCRCGETHSPSAAKARHVVPSRKVIAAYDYRDEKGTLLYQVLRYLPKGFSQRRPDGNNGWVWHLDCSRPVECHKLGHQPLTPAITRRVLYRLPELMKALASDSDTCVFVNEGEKGADALAELGFAATCSPHGAGKWRDEYSESLAGANVVLIEDNDEKGRTHTEVAGDSLRRVTENVKVLRLPSLPAGGDVVDFLACGGTRDGLFDLAASASAWSSGGESPVAEEWEEPIPFGLPTGLPMFPSNALPPVIRDMVKEVAAARQVSEDLPAVLSLGVLAACGAAAYRVALDDGYSEPLNLYVTPAADPGERKSGVFADLMEPMFSAEKQLREQAEPLVEQAQKLQAIAEAKYKHLITRASKDDATAASAARQELLDLDIPKAMYLPQLVAGGDTTAERIPMMLAEQNERLAVADAEGGCFFSIIAGRYSDGEPNMDVFLRGHAGDALRAGRVGRESIWLDHPALTLILTVQPEVLRGLAEKPGLRERGALARLLYALPQSRVGMRLHRERVRNESVLARYRELIERLAMDAARKATGGARLLSLSPGARQAFWTEADRIELAQSAGSRLEDFRGWGSKLAGAVGRIAGGLHLAVTGGLESTISAETMEGAIRIGRYFEAHALAAFGLMVESLAEKQAKRLLAWIQRRERHQFTERGATRDFSTGGRSADVKPGLRVLEEHSSIRRRTETPRRPGAPGRTPSPVYEVNPAAFRSEETSDVSDEIGGGGGVEGDSVGNVGTSLEVNLENEHADEEAAIL